MIFPSTAPTNDEEPIAGLDMQCMHRRVFRIPIDEGIEMLQCVREIQNRGSAHVFDLRTPSPEASTRLTARGSGSSLNDDGAHVLGDQDVEMEDAGQNEYGFV